MRCRPLTAVRAALPPALCLALSLLLAARAAADIIHYKDGRTIEGRIVERTDTDITVETDFGKVHVPLSKIDHIEAKETVGEEFARRQAAVKPDDVEGLFALATWARDHDLKKEQHALLLQVLAADPDHALANQMLGRTQLDGRWFEPDQLEAYVRSMEAQKKKEGFLFDDGAWRPEDEVMTKRGFRKWKGEWRPRREAETAADVEDLANLAKIEVTATSGEFITLFSPLPPDEATALLDPLDEITRDLLLKLSPTAHERELMLKYDVPIFLLPDADAVARFMDSGFVLRFSPVEGFEERFHEAGGFSLYWPRPMIGMRLVGGDGELRDDLQRLGVLSHQLTRLLVERFKGPAPCPGWVEAGFAALYEGLVTGDGSLSISSFGRDRDGDPLDPYVVDWTNYAEWEGHLTDPAQLAKVPPLSTILDQPILRLDSHDIGICWSVIRFMLEKHPAELVAYLRAFAAPPGDPKRPAAEMHAEAWKLAFADPIEKVDAEWRAWLATQPRLLPPERLSH